MHHIRIFAIIVSLLFLPQRAALASEVTVMVSGGFSGALNALATQYEKETGNSVIIVRGPSMGADPTSIPARLSHGQRADVVILVRGALIQLAEQHVVDINSVKDLGVGLVAMAVRSGAPRPDIGTVAALKRALLNANSVAYSDSASGIYLSTTLFKRLGISHTMTAKSKMIQATPVGLIIARGDYELGFQQLSELKGIPGIDIVGVIPEEVQQRTTFSAGLVTDALNPVGGSSLINFLSSPKAQPGIQASGLALVH